MLIICSRMALDLLPWELAETAHALRRAYGSLGSTQGVTRAQWKALAWVAREPGLRQVTLADKLDVEPITLCRIVDRLEEIGLVERQRDPGDRRAWRLHLTERAEPVLAELKLKATEVAGEVFAGFDPEEIARLRADLARIRENVEALDGAGKGSE